MAAPALAASRADCAICAGVTGTAGFLPGVSADPVTAQEIITLRCIWAPPARLRAARKRRIPKVGRLIGQDHAQRQEDRERRRRRYRQAGFSPDILRP